MAYRVAGIVVAIMEGARSVLKTIHLCVLSLIVLLAELIFVVGLIVDITAVRDNVVSSRYS